MTETKHKTMCPTRTQWRVLATLREGPTKYLHRPSNYHKGNRNGVGNLRTAMSVRKRGWVSYDETARHYLLSDSGRAALIAGDRRYLESEIAYARRLM